MCLYQSQEYADVGFHIRNERKLELNINLGFEYVINRVSKDEKRQADCDKMIVETRK